MYAGAKLHMNPAARGQWSTQKRQLPDHVSRWVEMTTLTSIMKPSRAPDVGSKLLLTPIGNFDPNWIVSIDHLEPKKGNNTWLPNAGWALRKCDAFDMMRFLLTITEVYSVVRLLNCLPRYPCCFEPSDPRGSVMKTYRRYYTHHMLLKRGAT